MVTRARHIYEFGPFRLIPEERQLLRDNESVRLTSKCFDLLIALIEKRGHLIEKDELMERVWPDSFVEEANLSVHMSALRRALGEAANEHRYVETVPGVGYRFVAGVRDRSDLYAHELSDEHDGDPVRIHSLAVLPLENLSGEPSQEYFADGMTDALIGELAKIGALRVISRTSAMYYKGTKKKLPEIADELKVDTVIEGTVMRGVDQVQVRVQLIQVAGDQHLWSETYDYNLCDVLTLQREAARDIAREIQVKLTPQEQTHFESVRQVNPEAYDHYLRGKFYLHRQNLDDSEAAITALEHAVSEDPNFAAAHAELAQA